LSRPEGPAGETQAIEKVEHSWSVREEVLESGKREGGVDRSLECFWGTRKGNQYCFVGRTFKTGLTMGIAEVCVGEKKRKRERRRGAVDI
jgi:hypothetical protein